MFARQEMAIDAIRLHVLGIVAGVVIVGLPGFVLLGHRVATASAKRRPRGVILGTSPTGQ
jgi:hypothetical protein